MSLRVLALGVVLVTVGACAGPQQLGLPSDGPIEPVAQDLPAEAHFACSFHWRQSDGHAHTQTERVALTSGSQRVTLHGFDVVVTADANRLELETTLAESTVRSSHVFEGEPKHLPAGGHGFTGLQYLTDRSTGAELQYMCGAYDAGVDSRDETASQSNPGPSADSASTVSCEASVTTAEGSELGPETFTLEPGGDHELPALGRFAFSVQHQVSQFEASAIIVEAGQSEESERLPTVHTLFQLSGTSLPANTMSGPSFTGVQSVEREGATLRYRCWTDG